MGDFYHIEWFRNEFPAVNSFYPPVKKLVVDIFPWQPDEPNVKKLNSFNEIQEGKPDIPK